MNNSSSGLVVVTSLRMDQLYLTGFAMLTQQDKHLNLI